MSSRNRKYRKEKVNEKQRKRKVIDFKWSKRPIPNQKQPSDLEVEMTHPFPEDHTLFNIF